MAETASTKVCTACGMRKSRDEFNRNRTAADGRQSQCRSCQSAGKRAYRAANPEIFRAQRERRRTANLTAVRAEDARWSRANRPKRAAGKRVYKAIRAGRLTRPERCESCGVSCKPHAHHKDYARPLDVAWLCARCHQRLHADKRKAADAA